MADIVMLGDSLTCYGDWQHLSDKLSISNHGIEGDTVSCLIRRLDMVARETPKVIFLLIGINDMLGYRYTLLKQYRTLLQSLKSNLPNTRILVQSILPIEGSFGGVCNLDIEEANLQLSSLANEMGMEFVDLHPMMCNGTAGNLASCCTTDGLHLSGEGYLRWQRAIRPYIIEAENIIANSEGGITNIL